MGASAAAKPIEPPAGATYDDLLAWALGHPDGDRAVLAAQIRGRRGARSALPALRRAVDESRDPYVAGAALRSAIAIAGEAELAPWLEQLAAHPAFMIRNIAVAASRQPRVKRSSSRRS